MKIWDWTLEKEEAGYGLWRTDEGWTVTGIDRQNRQVSSVIPGDMPQGGGGWVANISDAGVSYVSRPYSESYAKRIFREYIREQQEIY